MGLRLTLEIVVTLTVKFELYIGMAVICMIKAMALVAGATLAG